MKNARGVGGVPEESVELEEVCLRTKARNESTEGDADAPVLEILLRFQLIKRGTFHSSEL